MYLHPKTSIHFVIAGDVAAPSSAREHLLILFRTEWPFSLALVVLGRRNTDL
jgi:hypothetical protein